MEDTTLGYKYRYDTKECYEKNEDFEICQTVMR